MFYRVCAWALIPLTTFLIAGNVLVVIGREESFARLPGGVIALIGIATIAGVPAGLTLWPAMMWHSLFVNKSSLTIRTLWFLLVLCTFFAGALIYYFFVVDLEE